MPWIILSSACIGRQIHADTKSIKLKDSCFRQESTQPQTEQINAKGRSFKHRLARAYKQSCTQKQQVKQSLYKWQQDGLEMHWPWWRWACTKAHWRSKYQHEYKRSGGNRRVHFKQLVPDRTICNLCVISTSPVDESHRWNNDDEFEPLTATRATAWSQIRRVDRPVN
mgnify:CR=1 FL=1